MREQATLIKPYLFNVALAQIMILILFGYGSFVHSDKYKDL